MQRTTEFTASILAATTKDERKTKCSDKKEAIGNELLGNAFFLNDAFRTFQSRQAAKLAFLGTLKLRFRDQRD